ncbi:hypothetical protein Acy02nite_89490 [Actinoplanes cyaneus]|uniref:TadE-like domain-containing protein n=1 Tax=Actinoplanes cyaneus TaxID=52696 RepID=A0A919IWH9_9ACTN|nr:hypothetical protein [Actinoplanes cyaneus]GID71068.1 hypothetical protein Acy02nite_89490 [Actinoplanes cyaneus]
MVIPAVMLLMFLALQVAMYSYARSIALTAAQEGLTAARAYNSSAAAGSARAQDFIARAGGDSLTGTRVAATRSATQASVTVTGRSPSLLPGLRLTVSQTAVGPVERFVE